MIGILPYVQVNGAWTLPDTTVMQLWDRMEKDGTAKVVFYSGSVNGPWSLVSFLKRLDISAHFLTHGGKIIGMTWLTDIASGRAFAHFCFFREAWGNGLALEAGKKSLEYWFGQAYENGKPIFHTIAGATPDVYEHAVRFVGKLGGHIIGTIPGMLFDVYNQRSMGATYSYFAREEHHG